MSAADDLAVVGVDAAMICEFLAAIIPYNDGEGRMSARGFRENDVQSHKPAFLKSFAIDDFTKLAAGVEGYARKAAHDPVPTMLAMPLCSFRHEWMADEEHLHEAFALTAEIDGDGPSAVEKFTAILGSRPTVVVESGGLYIDPKTGVLKPKMHVHYRLSEPAGDPVAHAKLKNARALACASVQGGDRSNVPMVHPIRVPGSFHRKDKPRLCRSVESNAGAEIHLDEALEALREACIHLPPRPAPTGRTVDGTLGFNMPTLELWAQIAKGEALHDSTVSIAYRLIVGGTPPNIVLEMLRGFMLGIDAGKRDGRWEARFEDLARCVETAVTKLQTRARTRAEAEASEPNTEAAAAGTADHDDLGSHVPAWSRGYEMRPDGLYLIKDAPNSAPVWISAPFRVIATAADVRGGDHSTIIAFIDQHARPVEMVVGRGECMSDAPTVKARLAAAGLRFARKAGSDLLLDALCLAQSSCRETVLRKPGWTVDQNAFVLPDGSVLTASNSKRCARFRFADDHIGPGGRGKRAGTIEGAKELAALCGRNHRAVFSLSAAFAASLATEWSGAESRIYHFKGPSSRGKSTLLVIAASVWGDPWPLPNWDATANGLEAKAAGANDGLLILDEAHLAAPEILGEVVYKYCNEHGRSRMAQNAKTARSDLTWRGLALSSGETSIASRIRLAKGASVSAGQICRAFDLPGVSASDPRGAFDDLHRFEPSASKIDDDIKGAASRFSDELQARAREHYGHLGPAFIQAFLERREAARKKMADIRLEFVALVPDCADGQVQRGAKAFARIAAAGEIARGLLALDWAEGEAFQAAQQLFEAWRANTGGDRPREEGEALRRVLDYLDQHAATFENPAFDQRDNEGKVIRPHTPLNASGWVQCHEHGELLFVFNSPTFAGKLFPDMGATTAAKVLTKMGALLRNKEGRAQFEYKHRGTKIRGYAIRREMLLEAVKKSETGEDPTVAGDDDTPPQSRGTAREKRP